MMSKPRSTAFVTAVVALAVVAGACSGSDPKGAVAAGTAAKSTTTTTATSTTTAASGSAPGKAVPSPGCAAPGAVGTPGPNSPVKEERRTIDMAGTERWYLLTVPASAGAEPAPLVLDFHGLAEGAQFHTQVSGYSDLAEKKGFVVAFPNGLGQPAAWNIEAGGPNPDADFVDALVARLGADLCLDLSRVYATGLSNGALLTSVLGCSRSSTFAAVAPVAGVTFPPNCMPTAPVPIVAFHGTADPILEFNGGVAGDVLAGALSGQAVSTTVAPPADLNGPGYPEAMAKWAAANGCEGFDDTNVTATVIHRVWDCPEGADTEFWIVVGGGHSWPGGTAFDNPGIARIVGPTTKDISATELSWDFLSAHRRS
jgi:polyhydroxybutyrate depolymerase